MSDHSQSPLAEGAEALEAIEAKVSRLMGVRQLGNNPLVLKLMAGVSLQQQELKQMEAAGNDQSDGSYSHAGAQDEIPHPSHKKPPDLH